jgi:antitoxin (DNA-binding transcriptional repressor) of toxin-antitoxin stability system
LRTAFSRNVSIVFSSTDCWPGARDALGVLEKVRAGAEVVVEKGSQPVAIIKAPPLKGRNISEAIGSLEASGANATVDEHFARRC